jgi:hypothetical protein
MSLPGCQRECRPLAKQEEQRKRYDHVECSESFPARQRRRRISAAQDVVMLPEPGGDV